MMTHDVISAAWAGKARYSAAEIKRELKYELQPGFDVDANVRSCTLIIGGAGEGKSAVVEQAAHEAEAVFIGYHHGATIEEDNHGLPTIKDGISIHAPAAHLAAALYRKGEPDGSGERPILLFIDEVFSGQTGGHQNFVRMVIDRRYNEMFVKKNVRVVAATNPETAEYHLVKTPDLALAKRMIVLPMESKAEEKLEYWSSCFQSKTLYQFLLMHHFTQNSYVNITDARSWCNIAAAVAKREAAGASIEEIVKLLTINLNSAVATAFNSFLYTRNDPNKYPLSYKELTEADKDKIKVLIARVKRWIDERQRPLIGATKMDINGYIKNMNSRVKVTDQAADNLAAFMVEIGSNGFADMVDDICHSARQTPLMRLLSDRIRGTPLEKRFIELFNAKSSAHPAITDIMTKPGGPGR